jgi:hypothetical protein
MIFKLPFFTCWPQKEDLRSLTEDEADDVMKGAPVSPVFSPQRPQLTEVKKRVDADFLPHFLKHEFIKHIFFVKRSIFHHNSLAFFPDQNYFLCWSALFWPHLLKNVVY